MTSYSGYIGLFGGSFDPIHLGHVNLAVHLLEKAQLQEVWFCPAAVSPFKDESVTVAEHRLAMVRLATEGIPGVKVVDFELQRPAPSFTLDTINTLLSEGKVDKLALIVGDDSLSRFSHWRGYQEILERVPVLSGTRNSENIDPNLSSKEKATIESGQIATPRFEISSTEIRERLSQERFCGHLLHPKVLAYIKQHKLYSSETSNHDG